MMPSHSSATPEEIERVLNWAHRSQTVQARVLLGLAAQLAEARAELKGAYELLHATEDKLEAEIDLHARALHVEQAELVRAREALGWFLEDKRFQVAVGGNPIVVERMLNDARAILFASGEGE
jgi:hypothetical protein